MTLKCSAPFKKRPSFILLSLLAIGMAGCGDIRLSKVKDGGLNIASQGDFCTQPPDSIQRFTKFLFVIDKSGSNVGGNGGGSGTDPANAYRADNIEKFYITNKDNASIKWGYIAFGQEGNEVHAYISKNGDDQYPIFSQDPAAMPDALNKQRTIPDNGCTPYRGAISMAVAAIRNDIKDHPTEDSTYMVLFMSDGYPTDYIGGAGGCSPGPVGDAALSDVDTLMASNPGRVFLSTAYYGPPDALAAGGLERMAERGRGKFADLNIAKDFGINDLLVAGPSGEAYKMRSFMVYNVNSSICFDGSIGVDSDGDGLCDEDEKRLGAPFDPTNRFSYGDGYADYLHWYAKFVSKETLYPCNDRSDEDHDLLTSCEETYMYNSRPTGTDRITADPKNFDSDMDRMIDGIEFFMLHDKSAPLDANNLYRSYDGETENAYMQIGLHKNPLYPDAQLRVPDIYDTTVIPLGPNGAGQTCYKFKQNSLKTFATLPVSASHALGPEFAHPAYGNTVLVYYIETPERDPNGPGIYMYSLQTLSGTKNAIGSAGLANTLQINDRVFKQYRVPQ